MAVIQSQSYGALPLPGEARTIDNTPAPTQGSGQFRGEAVVMVSAAQSLADAAEELTFVFSERKEMSLDKRKLSDSHARVSEVEELVGEYLDKVPNMERQMKIKEMIAHLGSGRLSNLAQLLAYLGSFSDEPSEQFKALCELRDAIKARPELAQFSTLVERALVKLAEEQGQAIVLGARITPEAHQAASQGVASVEALRDTYRDAVMDYRGLSSAWRDLQGRFASSDKQSVIAFMQKALSADLQSQQRWLDPVKLERVVSDMQKLRLLSSMSAQVETFWQRFAEGKADGIRAF